MKPSKFIYSGIIILIILTLLILGLLLYIIIYGVTYDKNESLSEVTSITVDYIPSKKIIEDSVHASVEYISDTSSIAPLTYPVSEKLIPSIGKYNHDSEDVEYLARLKYNSCCDSSSRGSYESFKLWSVVLNRVEYSSMRSCKKYYGSSVKDVVTDRSEFEFWNYSVKYNNMYRRNLILAELFLDYRISSKIEEIPRLIDLSGLYIRIDKDKDGYNRYISALTIDGIEVSPYLTYEEYLEVVYPEFIRRLTDAGLDY